MRHNNVISGYPKSTGIPWVDGLSTGPLGFGASQMSLKQSKFRRKEVVLAFISFN